MGGRVYPALRVLVTLFRPPCRAPFSLLAALFTVRPILAEMRFLSGLLIALPALIQAQGTVSGRIIDKSTRTPVSGAEVIASADGRKVSADSAGRFSMTGVPTGAVRLVVRANGFPVST